MGKELKILKKHDDHHNRDHHDPDYKGLRDAEKLFDKIDEDYYKPVRCF